MTGSDHPSGLAVSADLPTPLVVRSVVDGGLPYADYRQVLRQDFLYSCGYCSLCEFEAQGLSFQIDHYEPQNSRPDLENEYLNLMYSCDECNRLKSDIAPPSHAIAAGYRFFRPDEDIWEHHFEGSGYRLNHRTEVGEFSIETLDLNRQSLRRLREIRTRLTNCNEHITKGVIGLRRFKIDQLPASIRAQAVAAINRATAGADTIANQVDTVLEAAAKSPLLDVDIEKAVRRAARRAGLAELKGIFPGAWRGKKEDKPAV